MSASPEAPIPLAGVAGFNRNQWQLSIGISGNLRLESVAGFDRNQWQPSRGIRKLTKLTKVSLDLPISLMTCARPSRRERASCSTTAVSRVRKLNAWQWSWSQGSVDVGTVHHPWH